MREGQCFFSSSTKLHLRILYLNIEERYAYVIFFNTEQKRKSGPDCLDLDQLAQLINQNSYVDKDPIKHRFLGGNIPSSLKKIRDTRYSLIEPIIKSRPDCYSKFYIDCKVKEILDASINPIPPKTENVTDVDQKSSKSPSVTKYKIQSALIDFFIRGETKNGLIPFYDKCGGRGKSRTSKKARLGRRSRNPDDNPYKQLDADDLEKIKNGYKDFYDPAITGRYNAYLQFLEKYYPNLEKDIPSIAQFTYQGMKLNDPVQLFKKSVGQIKYRKDYKSIVGTQRNFEAFGIGAEAQLDTTIDDTHALSTVLEDTFMGRLTISLMIDSATGMPFAVTCTPDNSNYYTACLTLICAATSKREYCKKYGVDIVDEDWPVKHLPTKILTDLGILFGPKADAVAEFGINIKHTESYRADQKGIVERHIGKLIFKIRFLLEEKGLVNTKDSKRIIADSRKQAIFNYRHLMALVLHEMLYYIKNEPISGYPVTEQMIADQVSPTPLNLWNWFMKKGLTALKSCNPDELAIATFPEKECSFNKDGVLFKGYRWQCEEQEGKDLLLQLRITGVNAATIKFCHVDTKLVFLYIQGKYYKMYSIDKLDYCTFYEVDIANRTLSGLNSLNERKRVEAGVAKIKAQNQIVKDAQKAVRGKPINVKNAIDAKDADKEHFHQNEGKPYSEPKKPVQKPSSNHNETSDYNLPDFLS